jgi:hypothetical protein
MAIKYNASGELTAAGGVYNPEILHQGWWWVREYSHPLTSWNSSAMTMKDPLL